METSGSTRAGRPIDETKTAAIVAAARAAFFEEGYSAASIERSAARAGVAKTTIYGRFGGKEGLFEAVIESLSATLAEAFAAPPEIDRPVEEVLRSYGTQVLGGMVRHRLGASEPMAMLEADRNPSLGAKLFDAGPGRVRRGLAVAIGLYAEAGVLRAGDAQEQAEDLMALWMGLLPFEARTKPELDVSVEALRVRVERGTRKFLELYGT